MRKRFAGLCLASGLAGLPAEAETLTLLDAIRQTLESNPTIALREQDRRFQAGVLQAETGRFDQALTTDVSWDYRRQEVRASVRQREREGREALQTEVDRLSDVRNVRTQIRDEIRQLQLDPTGFRVSDPDVQAQIDVINFEISRASPADRAQLIAARDDYLRDAVRAAEQSAADSTLELNDAIEDLTMLGPVPREEETFFGRFNVQYFVPFRNAITVAPFFEYTLDGDRFVDKPVDDRKGGKGFKDIYRASLGFTVDTPLLRDFGRKANAADEKAAAIDLEGTRRSLQHEAAARVLDTVLAYWAAVAATEQLAVRERSAALRGKIVEITATLVAADELPRAETARAAAEEATARAAVDDARRAAHEARLALSRAIGNEVKELAQAPLPSETFPTAVTAESLAAFDPTFWATEARARRNDYQAALAAEESGGVLLTAAELGLKPRLDLGTRFFYNSLDEGSGRRAFTGNWVGPSYSLGLQFEKAFKNNTQKGKLEQAKADAASGSIRARDLARLISSEVLTAFGSLAETRARLSAAEAAVSAYQESVTAELERLRRGSASLIDTLLTEERLTDAQLTLVGARAASAQLLARLRFATGTLISEDGEASWIPMPSLAALPERPAP